MKKIEFFIFLEDYYILSSIFSIAFNTLSRYRFVNVYDFSSISEISFFHFILIFVNKDFSYYEFICHIFRKYNSSNDFKSLLLYCGQDIIA